MGDFKTNRKKPDLSNPSIKWAEGLVKKIPSLTYEYKVPMGTKNINGFKIGYDVKREAELIIKDYKNTTLLHVSYNLMWSWDKNIKFLLFNHYKYLKDTEYDDLKRATDDIKNYIQESGIKDNEIPLFISDIELMDIEQNNAWRLDL